MEPPSQFDATVEIKIKICSENAGLKILCLMGGVVVSIDECEELLLLLLRYRVVVVVN